MTFLAGPLATAGATMLGSKLFGPKGGSKAPLENFAPAGINAGGLSTGFSGGNITVTPSAERLGLVRGISDSFGEKAGLLGLLRKSVAPGMSDLRTSRLGEIENARTSAIGNLRENLARRRVLGSSFGQDAITRAESEFAGQRDRVAAESFLQELELSNQLIDQEFTAARQVFQTSLDELNLEADVAVKLGAKATETLGANARALAELNAKEAAGAGKFFGQTFQPVADAFGKGVGEWFKR